MKQNIYDNPEFFAKYRALRDDDTGLNGCLEEPAMRGLIGEVRGQDVLDLGCGLGHQARWMAECGAKSVLGVDISEKMIHECARRNKSPACKFLRASAEDVAISRDQYDLVVSSMTLHYVADITPVVGRIFRGLRKGGRFVFSVEHPICTAHPVGWLPMETGPQVWPVRNYADEGARETKWFINGVIKYHRKVETYVRTLLAAGFMLADLREPEPIAEAMKKRPELEAHLHRPPVLMILARKF